MRGELDLVFGSRLVLIFFKFMIFIEFIVRGVVMYFVDIYFLGWFYGWYYFKDMRI